MERLSLAVGPVEWDDARRVVHAATEQLANLLGASMVRLYWAREAQDGFLLDPVEYENRSGLPDPQPFTVGREPAGPLSWVFTRGETLWLDDFNPDGTEPATNRATQEEVPLEYLNMKTFPCRSLLAIPLRGRMSVRGVFSVELPRAEGRLSDGVLEVMRHLGRTVTRLLVNADYHQNDLRKSGEAIKKFLSDASGVKIDPIFLTNPERNAFLARPFEPEFEPVEHAIIDELARLGIRGHSYRPQRGQHVVEEIMDQIRGAHFCMADITGANPNVMTEVGMMVMTNKELIILQDSEDQTDIPFDIADRFAFRYALDPETELAVRTPAENRMQPFGDILRNFTNALGFETGFHSATRWEPGPPEEGAP